MNKKINFRELKYWLPAVLYPILLILGYLVIDLFNFEVKEKKDASLVETAYLNADLPEAHVSSSLGDKMSNMRDQYGNIRDISGVTGIENDKDSVLKKEDYQTKYNEDERAVVLEQQRADSISRELRKRGGRGVEEDASFDEFVKALSPEERAKIEELRRRGVSMDLLEQELGMKRSLPADTVRPSATPAVNIDSLIKVKADSIARHALTSGNRRTRQAVRALDDEDGESAVVKKVTETSKYFNTVSQNDPESNMIKAIVDENMKIVDGSRVRLRLLDDVLIGNILLPKGTYLYATMSGFQKQRVRGKIESVMIKDMLHKINLSIYDADGLEGLYVPSSTFRETTRDVAGSALNTSMDVSSNISAGNSVVNWARQGLQNAYQRTSQAISKALRKNKVKLKYGTQVYLLNGSRQGQRASDGQPSRGRERMR